MDESRKNRPLSHRERDRVRGSETFKSRSRQLRKQATDAEDLLWRHLRARRMQGFKFRRQVAIEPYIVDFVCFEARLIIEADGGQHATQIPYDQQRTRELETRGYRILRFWNHVILAETESVLETIRSALVSTPSPSTPQG